MLLSLGCTVQKTVKVVSNTETKPTELIEIIENQSDNSPEWANSIPVSESNEFIVSFNQGNSVDELSKDMAAVFLARLHSSYVVKYEAYLTENNEVLPIQNKVEFNVVVAEDADRIVENYKDKIFLIEHYPMDSYCYSLYSYPDSVSLESSRSKILTIPEIDDNQTITDNNYIYSRKDVVSDDLNRAADIAFKECLQNIAQYFVTEVNSSTSWTERMINNNDPAGFGRDFITMESRYLLQDARIIKLTAFHEVKKNLHYYKVSITLMKKI